MRTFTTIAALLLLAGCQGSSDSPPRNTTQAPPDRTMPDRTTPAQTRDQTVPSPPVAKKEEPKRDRFPLDQDQFKAAVKGSTRDQVLEKFGPPDELGDWGPAVGWDGPVSIYRGPFTSADGKQAAKARIYFRRSGQSSVVAMVDFVNK